MAELKPFDGELDPPDGLKPFDGQLDGQKSGIIRRAADVGVSALKGAISVPEAAVGIGDLVSGGRVGKAAESFGFRPKEAKAMLDDLYSPEQKAANAAVRNADGFVDTLGAAVQNPSTIAHGIVESLPLMGAGGVIGRGAMALAPRIGAIGAGAIGEGVTAAGSAAEQVRQQTDDGLLTGKQAALTAGSGLATGLIGRAGGALANKLGIGDVDAMIVRGSTQVAGQAGKAGILGRAARGFASEGLFEELPQSVQEQALQNVALDKPIGEGVGGAAAMGLLTGGLMGAGAGAISRPTVEPAVTPSVTGGGAPPDEAAAQPAMPPEAQPVAPAATEPAALPPNAGPITRAASMIPAVQMPLDATNVNPETGEIRSAVQVREQDRPRAQEGDILNVEGQPFPSLFAAKRAAREAGPDFAPIKLGTGQFVVRQQIQEAANVSNPDATGREPAGVGGSVGVDALGSRPDSGLGFDGAGRRGDGGLAGVDGAGTAEDTASPDAGQQRLAALSAVTQPVTNEPAQGVENAQATQAPQPARAEGISDAGAAAVQADGLAAGPGSDAGNGFKQGPEVGERYRVGVVDSVGGAVSLEKRLPGGTSATFYVGNDGNLIDGDSLNLIDGNSMSRLWIPDDNSKAGQAEEILGEMGKMPLSDPRRADLKKRLKALVTAGVSAPASVVPESTDPFGTPASWVIREKATGRAVMETFDKAKVRALNTEKYEAVPILDHLASLNSKPASQPETETTAKAITQPQEPTPYVPELEQAAQTSSQAPSAQGEAPSAQAIAATEISTQENVNGPTPAQTLTPEAKREEAQPAAAGVARPANWRTNALVAQRVARQMGLMPTSKKLADVVAQIEAADVSKNQPEIDASAQRVGVNNISMAAGGKPFKTSKAASNAKKLQPAMRVVRVPGGYALAPKTEKQLAAEAKAAQRLSQPRTSAKGEPIPAHAFIAAAGGMHLGTRKDMGVDGNPRVGNRTLFAGLGRGLSIEQATQQLIQEQYLPEGASHSDALALIRKSLTKPQYNSDGIERLAQADMDARFDDYLAAQQDEPLDPLAPLEDGFTEADMAESGYTGASDAIKAEVQALLAMAEAKGIDTEAIKEDAAQSTADGSEEDYYEAAKSALEAAVRAGEGNRSPDAGSQGEARGQDADETEGLTAPTRDDILARQDRADRIEREQAQADKEAERRAQADAERDSFTLTGSDRAADVAAAQGQGDIFGSAEDRGQQRAETSTQRTRPRETITFAKPIIGPSGAKVLSYTWQWKPVEFIDKRGEERTKRISDWGGSETNAETGREVVHQFVVEDAEGEQKTVSAETAMSMLGFAQNDGAAFKSAASAAKTLARLKMQLAELEMAKDAFDKDKAAVDAMPLPPLPTQRENGWWVMGDSRARQADDKPMTDERRKVLVSGWRDNRLSERGWKGGAYAGEQLSGNISDVSDRIKRAQKRLDDLAKQPAKTQRTAATTPEESRQKPDENTKSKIDDFGEKIGGARKDVWTSFKDDLGAVADDDIANQPLSKIWPQPDYQALLDSGSDPWAVAFAHAARGEIGAKPRQTWKVKRWAEQVRSLRDMTMKLMDGQLSVERAKQLVTQFSSQDMRDLAGRVDLYMLVGHRKSLDGIRVRSGEYSLYNRVEYKPPRVIWTVEKEAAATAFSNWPRELATGATREEALNAFKEKYDSLEINPAASKETTFDVYSRQGEKGYWIGKKIGRNPIFLAGPFDNIRAARDYKASNQAELVAKLEKAKEIPRERRDTNEPRVGEDMRNGQDVTPQMFGETFGFRGVEFGNWVEQGRRQKDLNEAFDALMDMAAVIGVPPKALSLNGELGLAFGARGGGGVNPAAAHYERDKVVINLTKKSGAGSLGHEWWHSLDNYFSRMRSKSDGMMTDALDVSLASRGSPFQHQGTVRKEMIEAFGAVMKSIRQTSMKARSAKLDAKRSKEYWTTDPEMSARAFESYLISKLQDQEASNDYLANIVAPETWKAAESLGFELDDSYPYPTAGEIPAIRAGFDHFFRTIESRETENGVALFSRKPLDSETLRALLAQRSGMATKESVSNAVRTLVNGMGLMPNKLGRVVVTTASEIKSQWEPLIGQITLESEEEGRAQGFYDPNTKTVFIIADHIRAGDEIGVVAHELMHKHGVAVLGQAGWDKLHGVINGWADAPVRSLERRIYKEAARRVQRSAPDLSSEELFPYAVQVAMELGVKPNAMAPQNTVAKWLAQVRQALRQVWEKITAKPDLFNSQDLVNLAFGIAQRENPAYAKGLDDAVAGENEPSAPDSIGATNGVASPAFRKWFGDSKVVDAEGKPLVVYHGTTGDFSAFDAGKLGDNTKHVTTKMGFFFSEDPDVTTIFNTKIDDTQWPVKLVSQQGANTMPVYLSIKNPLEMTVASFRELEPWTRDELRAAGYDGVRIIAEPKMRDTYGGDEWRADTWVALDPEQIKSAIGNNGQFDPANPDIRYSRAAGVGERLGDTIKAVTATNLKERAGYKFTDLLGLGLQALGRRQLVDIYGDMLPLDQYNKLVAQMEADKNEGGAEADKLATRWGSLKDERQLSELMHDATLAQIDPAQDYKAGDNSLQYKVLQARLNALSDDAKQVYRDARDAYKAHHEKVRQAIRERIDRSELKGERKAALLRQMDEEFFKAIKGVYFPLARFGQYLVVVKGSDGKVESVNRAETMAEAQALRRNLQTALQADKGKKVSRVMLSKEFIADRDSVGRGFMTELYDVLDKQDMDAAQRAELEDTLGQLYLSSLPDLSWAKHGIHRKGTPGFSQDARRAFAQNMFHGARYLAKLRYSDLMTDELAAMQKHVDNWREVDDFDQPAAQRVVDEFNKRHESLMNPKSNPLSTALTSFGFIFHLGLSPASAMVNLSQTALVAYPVMGAKWGYDKAASALLKASQQAVKGKNDLRGALNAEEQAAYDEAVRSGVIDVTMAHDLAGIAQGEDAGVMWKLRPVMKWASFLFHHAERFNRQVTFVAAYRLAREANADTKSAFDQAVKATYDGHFDYGAANRPRVMQGNVAKVLLLFKQYGQNMVYTLSRQAYLAVKAESTKDRAEARKALGGLLTSHALAAGVLGLPMVTTLLAAASMLGGDDDEPWDAEVALKNLLADTFGKKPAEVLTHGLSRLTPWDISGRVGLDKLILPDLQEGLEGKRLAESAMASALGPVAGIGVNVLKGLQQMSEGRYARGLEDMLPAALRAPVKSLRYANEGAQDKTGISIVDEVSPAAVIGQALGFSPSEVRRATEGKSAIMEADRALNERRSHLVSQFAMAAMASDTEGMQDARQDIARFNEKNPDRRITPLNLIASVRARTRRANQAEDGVYLPKNRNGAREAGRFAFPE